MSLYTSILRTSYWIKDYFNGSPIGSELRDIKKIMSDLNSKGSQKRRKELLDNIISHARENSEFYKTLNPSELSECPVVDKLLLRTKHGEIAINKEKLPFQNGEYHIQRTSGSTGAPFALPQDLRKRRRRIAELKYTNQVVGFNSHERLIQLRIWTNWHNKSTKQAVSENIFPVDISNLTDENLHKICNMIADKRVHAVRGYASSFDIIGRFAIKHSYDFSHVKVMIAGSEALDDATRDIVNNDLHSNIISQYANEENGILAQENLGERKFYLNHAGYYFEVLKFESDEPTEEGEIGRVVITDYFNYAFPMIRYDTGDTAIAIRDTENHVVAFEKIYGRKLDMVFDANNKPIFPMAFARILKNYPSIEQWQFIQETKFDYNLKLIVEQQNEDVERDILNRISELCGNGSRIVVEYVDGIPVLKSGKRKSVICKLEDA